MLPSTLTEKVKRFLETDQQSKTTIDKNYHWASAAWWAIVENMRRRQQIFQKIVDIVQGDLPELKCKKTFSVFKDASQSYLYYLADALLVRKPKWLIKPRRRGSSRAQVGHRGHGHD